jgi:FRG domain
MSTYIQYVGSVEEALALVHDYKKSGKFDFFRGQARSWNLVSSLCRHDISEFDELQKKIARFQHFLLGNVQLKGFTENVNQFYAIAQHYGLTTNYIDFTTDPEVAAYFATNSKDNVIGEYAAIICLNSKEFADFIESLKKYYPPNNYPEIINIDVSNLWRLQSQKGCFLYLPTPDFESKFYPFDRVLFPFSASRTAIPLHEIYPNRKSQLEILLDQYFMNEQLIEGDKRIDKSAWHVVSYEPEDVNTFLVKNECIHESWNAIDLSLWNNSTSEQWTQVYSKDPAHTVNLFIYKVEDNDIAGISAEISRKILSIDNNRELLLSFHLELDKSIATETTDSEISLNCNKIWDGMRNLPYSIQEICLSISRYIYYEIQDDPSTSSNTKQVLTEFGSDNGAYSRALILEERIRCCFRDDLAKILRPEYVSFSNNARDLLKAVNKPRIIFEFERFRKLFFEDIIPGQMFAERDLNRGAIFYSPLLLDVFGLA